MVKARAEIDHVADWVATERTELDELTKACGHHHDHKTHHGHWFGPRRPNGKRQLIPRQEPGRAPGDTGPPDHHLERPALAVVDGPSPPEPNDAVADVEPDAPPAPPDQTPPRASAPSSLEERARAIGRRGQGNLFDTG